MLQICSYKQERDDVMMHKKEQYEFAVIGGEWPDSVQPLRLPGTGRRPA